MSVQSEAGPVQDADILPPGGTAHDVTGAGGLFLDAEALYLKLLPHVRALCTPQTRLVGITSGGASRSSSQS